MKKVLILSLTLALLTIGCHAQIPANPTVYSCPATTGTIYTQLNQASPATGLTYTDNKPAAGVYCYIAQSVNSQTGQVSTASNTAGPVTLDGVKSTYLSWNAPTTGGPVTGYVLSRAPAIASTIGAPALTTPSVASVAKDAPAQLVASLH